MQICVVGTASSNKRFCFDTRSLHVRSVVDKMALEKVLLRVLRFSAVISLHQSSILHPHTVLSRRTKGEAWKPSNRQCSFGNCGALDRKILSTWSLSGHFDLKIKNAHNLPYTSTSYGQKQTCFLTLGNETVTHEIRFN